MNPSVCRLLCLSLVLCAQGCEGTPRHRNQGPLRTGAFVEVKGRLDTVPPTIEQVAPVERKADDTSDKFELVAPVQQVTLAASRPTKLQVLGVTLEVNERTEFEDKGKKRVEAFVPTAGQWFKVKAKTQDEGLPRARTVRSVDEEDRFTVIGEVRDIDTDTGIVEIGKVPLRARRSQLPQDGGSDASPTSDDPLAQFQADETRSVPFSIGLMDNLRVGGQLAATAEKNDEFDFDRSRADDRTTLDGEAKVDLLWTLDNQGSFALLEGAVGRHERSREGAADSHTHKEEISRAYAFLKLGETWSVQAGRQDFYDEREWLYDEILDGVRARWKLGDFSLEGGVAMGRELVAEANATENTSLFTAIARYRVDDDHRLTLYAVQRKDQNVENFEPFLFGVRSYSRPAYGLGHWFELAQAIGYVGRTRIDGHAFDIGGMYRFDAPLKPTVALGYAFGSGREDGRIGFRQTGLQDNNGKFGGVTRFRYYGEVMEPELANLAVTTLGAGIRPFRSFAVDALFHTYRQDKAATSQADTKLRTNPNGISRDLGYGVDLVFGYRAENMLTLELVIGLFEPGAAFGQEDTAHKVAFVGRFKF